MSASYPPGTVLTWATVRCPFFTLLLSPLFFFFKCIATQKLAQGLCIIGVVNTNIIITKFLKKLLVGTGQSFPSKAMFHQQILICWQSYSQTHTGHDKFWLGLKQDSERIWPSFLPAHLAAFVGTQPHKLCLMGAGPPYGVGTSALLQLPCSLPHIPEL